MTTPLEPSRGASLDAVTSELRRRGRKAFVPYLMAGFPSRGGFMDAAAIALDCGADVLEIGVPFSDPLADGPVIQAAGKRALANAITPQACLDLAHDVHARAPRTPLVLMIYMNSILAAGGGRFLMRAAAAGVLGVIVPDLDLARAQETDTAAALAGLALIRLVAPITPAARARRVLAGARGFAYLVSVTGVTGARHQASFTLGPYVRRMRRLTRLPLYVGFGVSTAEQARAVCTVADGAVVGSALLEALHGPQPLRMLGGLCTALRNGCNRAGARA
ncbi:MAG: tryptophan synthase subunit alpha [Planctomycetota bacterium]